MPPSADAATPNGPSSSSQQTGEEENDSGEDFEMPKRLKTTAARSSSSDEEQSFDASEAAQKNHHKKDENAAAAEEDDDENCCPICFEGWTSTGSHRLVSLRCGHLFGSLCIERWLANTAAGQKPKCPQCCTPAKKSDIRCIFSKKIVVANCEERDALVAEAAAERGLRLKAQEEAARINVAFNLALVEAERLRRQNATLQSQLDALSAANPTIAAAATETPHWRFFRLQKTFSVGVAAASSNEVATCFDADSHRCLLAVGRSSAFGRGDAFGIGKINVLAATSDFFAIHAAPIKQLRFSPFGDDLLLSASLDKTLKLSSLACDAAVLSYGGLPFPAWSCAFHASNRNLVYAGLADGSLWGFDLRNTKQRLFSIDAANLGCSTKTPLHSLYAFGAEDCAEDAAIFGANFKDTFGVQLAGSDGTSVSHFAAFQQSSNGGGGGGGTCSHFAYDSQTRLGLSTMRAGDSTQLLLHRVRPLSVANLHEDLCSFVAKKTCRIAHSTLPRSALFTRPADVAGCDSSQSFAAYADESHAKIVLSALVERGDAETSDFEPFQTISVPNAHENPLLDFQWRRYDDCEVLFAQTPKSIYFCSTS